MTKQGKRTKREENPDKSGTLAEQATGLLDALELEIKQADPNVYVAILGRAGSIIEQLMAPPSLASIRETEVDLEDPEMQLEQVYQELQSHLIQVRQAVAQAIATEKHLEQQLQKNKDQAETWQERATLAEKKNNADLADQARLRLRQYVDAAGEIERHLVEQKETRSNLRQKLTDLEANVQKVYVQKQALLARNKAAQATAVANQIIESVSADDALSELKRLEQIVIEREAQAAKSAPAKAAVDQSDYLRILSDAKATLQSTIDAIARLEELIDRQKKN